jgi:uracil-DNA glycosylase
MKPLLVGQAPSKRTNSHGGRAFTGLSGRRLARLIGVEVIQDAFDCIDLVRRWPGRKGERGDVFKPSDFMVDYLDAPEPEPSEEQREKLQAQRELALYAGLVALSKRNG